MLFPYVKPAFSHKVNNQDQIFLIKVIMNYTFAAQ